MPTCKSDGCNVSQSKLNQGHWCTQCFRNKSTSASSASSETTTQFNTTEIAGIPISDIEQIPALTHSTLGEPITTGAMLKIMADVMRPIHERLNDHERRICILEKDSEATKSSVKQMDTDLKNTTQRITASETKIRNLESNNEKLKTVITKQQSLLVKQDKNTRLKNVIVAGLSENESLCHNGDEATTDEEKLNLIFNYLKAPSLHHIEFVRCHRIGNPDQGPSNLPRFLLIEFKNQDDRNKVKTAGTNLKDIPALKHIRIKADLTKAERDEYKRLYDLKDKLCEDYPTATVVIEKGTVKLNGEVVDKYKTPTTIF